MSAIFVAGHDGLVESALIRKFSEAQERDDPAVTSWGTGQPRHDFLHADDLVGACLFLIEKYSSEAMINIGWGNDISIAERADLIKDVVGCGVELDFDTTRINRLDWRPRIPLPDGFCQTHAWYQENR